MFMQKNALSKTNSNKEVLLFSFFTSPFKIELHILKKEEKEKITFCFPLVS